VNTRLVLIRHGESEDNVLGRLSGWTDSGLTAIGVEQARRMARYVAGMYRPSALYASSLARAVRTAEPLAQLTGLPITVRDDLRELHFGDLDGLSVPEILARFPSEWERAQDEEDVTFRFPGGETRVEFYERVQRAFSDLIRSHAGQTVAVVSHGGVLSSFLADVAEGKPQRWRSFLKDNCALSELLAETGGISIVRWNFTDYLK
jgi:probable phosphoglycerate mutase